MAVLHLFGGECDGHLITVTGARPATVYAVPLSDTEKVREAKGKEAKIAIHERLATLAYDYVDDGKEYRTQDGTLEFRYYRCPEKDRSL